MIWRDGSLTGRKAIRVNVMWCDVIRRNATLRDATRQMQCDKTWNDALGHDAILILVTLKRRNRSRQSFVSTALRGSLTLKKICRLRVYSLWKCPPVHPSTRKITDTPACLIARPLSIQTFERADKHKKTVKYENCWGICHITGWILPAATFCLGNSIWWIPSSESVLVKSDGIPLSK